MHYRGHQYVRLASPINTQYFRERGLLFWIYALCTSKTGANLPGRAKAVRKIPPEVERAVRADADVAQAVHRAIENHLCWFVKIEGLGWHPWERRGDKAVATVQSVLDWLQRFEHQHTVDGSHLLFAAIETKIER